MVKIGDKLMLVMCEDVDMKLEKNKAHQPRQGTVEWIHPQKRFCRVAFPVGNKGKKVYQSFHIQNGEVVV